MFLNLYHLTASAFRDHNFSDFWNEGGGGEPIEEVDEGTIEGYIRASYAPDRVRPGRLEGFPPDFQPILPFTLSAACCESFIRGHAALPIRPRDYYLSKIYQFLYVALVVRYWPQAEVLGDPMVVTSAFDIRLTLQSVLDAIPDDQLQKCCTSEMGWWWNFYDDTLSEDFETVLARIPEYLSGATTPADKRTRKMVPDPHPFPTLKGESWGDLAVRFTSDERVQLTIGTRSETRNFSEMGFEDKRQEVPDVSWDLLRRLAEHRGALQNEQEAGCGWTKVEKRIQVIRRRFKAIFQIAGDPFEPYQEARSYRAKFKVECARSFNY